MEVQLRVLRFNPEQDDAFKILDDMVDVAEGELIEASYRIATNEAVRDGQDVRIVPADAEKCEEAEFIMLKDGVIHFEGHAAELRASKDPYLHTFLS